MGVKLSQSEFMDKVIAIHGDMYDYSLTEFRSLHGKIQIVCKEHGVFEQEAGDHLKGYNCNICAIAITAKKNKSNTFDFVGKCKLVHGSTYEYTNIKYIDNLTKVEITCSKHGNWQVMPGNFLQGSGCPFCNNSKGEAKIKLWLETNSIKYITEAKFDNLKSIRHLRFDFYLPDHNIFIEYDGIQHFEPASFSGKLDIEYLERIKNHDKLKDNFVNLRHGTMFRIKYNEDITNRLLKLKEHIEG